jgi:integrase/recombinase XerC
MGATPATLRTYQVDLGRFAASSGVVDLSGLTREAVEAYLAGLRARIRPVSVHQHYRALHTFCRWLVQTGRIEADPMAGLRMRCPKTLPRVPTDEEVRGLLEACPKTFEGLRNRAMVALLAGSGLRKDEARRLRIGDIDLTARLLQVRQGKGQRDRVGFFGDAAVSALRAWLAVHPDPRPAVPLFVKQNGELLGPWAVVRILHRLSRRAKLARPIGPHALRHYCATALLRRTGDLELVRRVLGHSTLAMALRYAALTQTDIAAKFEAASPLDHLWTGGTLSRLTTGAGGT